MPYIVVAVIPAPALVKSGVKSLCQFTIKPTIIQAFKEEIRRCISEIPPQLCQTVIENFVKRTQVSQQSQGKHLPECCSINNSHMSTIMIKSKFRYFLKKMCYLKFNFSALVGTPYISEAQLIYNKAFKVRHIHNKMFLNVQLNIPDRDAHISMVHKYPFIWLCLLVKYFILFTWFNSNIGLNIDPRSRYT